MFISNLDELRRAHDEFLASQERIIELTLNQAGAKAVEHVRTEPEFKPQTGALQRATRFRVVKISGGRLMRLTNSKAYADVIEGGSKAHVIQAKAGKFLRFVGKNGTVFARRVNHPGTKPYRFMSNAHAAADRFFRVELERDLTALAARF